MLQSTISHGGITYDLRSDGYVSLARVQSGETWCFSPSEIRYFTEILKLHGWPVVPPPEQKTAPT